MGAEAELGGQRSAAHLHRAVQRAAIEHEEVVVEVVGGGQPGCVLSLSHQEPGGPQSQSGVHQLSPEKRTMKQSV